jgi:hypothetical protein
MEEPRDSINSRLRLVFGKAMSSGYDALDYRNELRPLTSTGMPILYDVEYDIRGILIKYTRNERKQ